VGFLRDMPAIPESRATRTIKKEKCPPTWGTKKKH